MNFGDLFKGLCALDVVRVTRNTTKAITGMIVDAQAVPLQTEALGWDDLRFPAQGINPAGPAAPPSVDTTDMLGTLLFSGSQVNTIAGVAQMPHAWKPGTQIHPHIHWTKTNSNAGDVVWTFKYAIANVGEVFPAYSAPLIATHPVPNANTNRLQALSAWDYLDMTGFRESCTLIWVIERLGNDGADTYASNARLLEFDIHFQSEKVGSEFEIPHA